jgi:hypothetical protein
VSLEAPDNPSVTRLNKGCQIRLEEFNLNILGLIRDIMSREVVQKENNLSVLPSHDLIHSFDPPKAF